MILCRVTRPRCWPPFLLGAAVMKYGGGRPDWQDCLRKLFTDAPPKGARDRKDIVDTALSSGSFVKLLIALQAADLIETLKGEGPFTVFAPSNDAFGRLPQGTLEDLLRPENQGKLQAILTYHVLPGKLMAADLTKMADVIKAKSAKTVNGQLLTITVEEDTVIVDKAKVIKTDLASTNGVIHVIDSVLLPKET